MVIAFSMRLTRFMLVYMHMAMLSMIRSALHLMSNLMAFSIIKCAQIIYSPDRMANFFAANNKERLLTIYLCGVACIFAYSAAIFINQLKQAADGRGAPRAAFFHCSCIMRKDLKCFKTSHMLCCNGLFDASKCK